MATTIAKSASLLDGGGGQLLPNTRGELVWLKRDPSGSGRVIEQPMYAPTGETVDTTLSYILSRTPRLEKDNTYLADQILGVGNKISGTVSGAVHEILQLTSGGVLKIGSTPSTIAFYVGSTHVGGVSVGGIYSNAGVAALGIMSAGTSGSGGALYELADVKAGDTYVQRADGTAATLGDVLAYNGEKWYALENGTFVTMAELTARLGAANGIATLDGNSKILTSQLPDYILGQLLYGGNVDGTGVCTLSSQFQAKYGITQLTLTSSNYASYEGVFFIATANATSGVPSSLDVKTGDWVVSIGTAWKKVDNTDAVTGVKGSSETNYRTGNVTISKSDIGLGNVENTALSTWGGSGNITTVGTITSGTWNGSAIGVTKGGTGLTTIAAGKMLYASASNTLNVIDTSSFGRSLLNTAKNTVVANLYAAKASALVTSIALSIQDDNSHTGTASGFDGSANFTLQLPHTIDVNNVLIGRAGVAALGVAEGGTSGSAGAMYELTDVIAHGTAVGRSISAAASANDLLAYDGSKWHAIDPSTMTSGNVTAVEADAPNDRLKITKGDGTIAYVTVPYATKALQDGGGNSIAATYATKTELTTLGGNVKHLQTAQDIENTTNKTLTRLQQDASGVITATFSNIAIAASQVTSGTFNAARIADGSITGAKLVNATITAAQLANSAVTAAKIADDVFSVFDTGDFDSRAAAHTKNYGVKITIGEMTRTIARDTAVPIQAENIYGLTAQDTEGGFVFRPTATQSDGTGLHVNSGNAELANIYGNTIVWNQLVQNGNFSDGTQGWSAYGASIVASNGELEITTTGDTPARSFANCVNFPILATEGNKVLISFSFRRVGNNASYTVLAQTYPNDLSAATGYTSDYTIDDDAVHQLSEIISVTGDTSKLTIHPNTNSSTAAAGDAIRVSNVMVINLTKMFGAGQEPEIPEQFREMFPLDYYEYDAGTETTVNFTAIESVGKNQWDEKLVVGYYSMSGVLDQSTSSTRKSSSHMIKVFPNTTYYIRAPFNSVRIIYYALDHKFISYADFNNSHSFTTPDTCYYINFSVWPYVSTTYRGDICLNLSWSGYRDGTYDAYWKNKLDLSWISRLEDGRGERYFPYGLLSVGAVYDEIDFFKKKIYKRVGFVDLGTVTWTYDNGIFIAGRTQIRNMYYLSSNVRGYGLICSMYNAATTTQAAEMMDKDIGATYSTLRFIDASHTGSELTKGHASWLEGVMLYYVYRLPIEIDIPEGTNVDYPVDDLGTEGVYPSITADPAIPFKGVINYGINVRDTVRALPGTYIRRNEPATESKLGLMGLGYVVTDSDSANKQAAVQLSPDGKAFVVTQLGYIVESSGVYENTPNFEG